MTAADSPGSDRHSRDDAVERDEGTSGERYRLAQDVQGLRTAHADVRSAVETAALEAGRSDPSFVDAFEEWAVANDVHDLARDEQAAIAATQHATLLLQGILRYEADRRRSGSMGDDASEGKAPEPLTRLIDDAGELDLRELEDRLDRLGGTAAFDGATARPFASFLDDEQVRRRVADMVRTVQREHIDGLDGSLPGEFYEALIPDDERRAGGQFYTPPAIAEALVRWALLPGDTSKADRIPSVLDPAAGCGTFLGEAYRFLAERFPDAAHDNLLDHLVAVDVERFPLRLTALNLADRGVDGMNRSVRAYHGSFFDLEPAPGDDPVDPLGLGDASGEIGPVDAVVGNPPYVEASDLVPDVEHFRDHLRTFGPGDATPYVDGPDAIPRNADAYVYFVTHATRFLDDGGRLAFVVPTKWLSSRYGEGFRSFLHDHYRIAGIVGFDARAFEDAIVDTALLFLERCDDREAQRENVVPFVQLHDELPPDALLDAIDDVDVPPGDDLAIERTSTYRTVGVRQPVLAEEGKIAHYLFAPEDLLDLLDSPQMTALGDLADVKRGAMTGSTAFFFPDEDDVAAHGVEDEFLTPALKSMRGSETMAYDEDDVDRWFVDVHDYVEEVQDREDRFAPDQPLEERVKRALDDDGYEGLRSWIRNAETEGEHRGETCERREVWFDFGEPPRPEILFQKLLRERLFSIYNRVDAVPSNAVDCIDVHPDVDSRALFGVLNSSIVRASMEVRGRNEAGMLQLMTYETRTLPVPDVRSMSEAERGRIATVVNDVLEDGSPDVAEEDRDRLDAAVLSTLDSVEMSVDRIQSIQRFLLERRVRSGASTDVLVGEGDRGDEP